MVKFFKDNLPIIVGITNVFTTLIAITALYYVIQEHKIKYRPLIIIDKINPNQHIDLSEGLYTNDIFIDFIFENIGKTPAKNFKIKWGLVNVDRFDTFKFKKDLFLTENFQPSTKHPSYFNMPNYANELDLIYEDIKNNRTDYFIYIYYEYFDSNNNKYCDEFWAVLYMQKSRDKKIVYKYALQNIPLESKKSLEKYIKYRCS